MGVQDNPRVFGNWIKTGLGGCANIIERLTAEGYQWDDEELIVLNEIATRLRAVTGSVVGAAEQDLTVVVKELDAELSHYKAAYGPLV